VFDPTALYGFLKWLAPILGAAGFAIKVRGDVLKRADDWANKLLNNHLAHIQEATIQTVSETQTTNKLLSISAQKDIEVSNRVLEVKETLLEHHEKEQQVWGGILNTLSVLEDRTRRARTKTAPRRKR
jgi:hypothetical protein